MNNKWATERLSSKKSTGTSGEGLDTPVLYFDTMVESREQLRSGVSSYYFLWVRWEGIREINSKICSKGPTDPNPVMRRCVMTENILFK